MEHSCLWVQGRVASATQTIQLARIWRSKAFRNLVNWYLSLFSRLWVSSLCHTLTYRLRVLLCLYIWNSQNKPSFCCALMLCCNEKVLKSQWKGSFSHEQNRPPSPAGWVPKSLGKHLLRVTQIELLSPEAQAGWGECFGSLKMISYSPTFPTPLLSVAEMNEAEQEQLSNFRWGGRGM